MHFPIGVITKGMPSASDIEELLAPFQENNMGTVPEEYLEFCPIDEDEVNDYRTEYEEKTIEKDGQERPIKDVMSFHEYMTEHVQYEYDEETQQYGYYSNPNSHWDWYQIGGRWCAEIDVPANCDCVIGEKSWGYENEDPYKCNDLRYKKCDGARIKSMVFPHCEEQKTKAARFWEIYIEGATPQDDEEKKILEDPFRYTKEYYLTNFKTKENYVRCMSSFSLYGYLKDGEWVEKGWACRDEVEWLEKFHKAVIEGAGNDDWITIVDCHV